MEDVDTAPSQPAESSTSGDLLLPDRPAVDLTPLLAGISTKRLHDLWQRAEAASVGIDLNHFDRILATVGDRHHHGQPSGSAVDEEQRLAFYNGLRLPDLALAQACALGKEAAWQRFLDLYRVPLTQAAIAITRSASLGHELADALYSELFGLRTVDGLRISPLGSYSGRGSLLGWLRTTLAQRHVDHHRRTHRETPLDPILSASLDPATPPPATMQMAAEVEKLGSAVSRALASLDAQDRFLLSSYYLDRQTLLQIARLLRVHEATISRRLKRLIVDLRKQLLKNLQSAGLSKRQAEEALGADPRDLEINLRTLLQTSSQATFLSTKEPESATPARRETP